MDEGGIISIRDSKALGPVSGDSGGVIDPIQNEPDFTDSHSTPQKNKLYVGGLSWGTTSEGSSDNILRVCDGIGGCTFSSVRRVGWEASVQYDHPDLYKNIWVNGTELPRQKHPDFLWWPTGKPAPASDVDARDYVLWRKYSLDDRMGI